MYTKIIKVRKSYMGIILLILLISLALPVYAAYDADFLFDTYMENVSQAVAGVNLACDSALQAGYSCDKLIGDSATVQEVRNYLLSDNVRGIGNIGKGKPEYIDLSDGRLTYPWFDNLSDTALNGKVIFFNSCLTHIVMPFGSLVESIMGAGARTYIGGDTLLPYGDYNSIPVFTCFWEEVLKNRMAMGVALAKCEEEYGFQGYYGFSGDTGVFDKAPVDIDVIIPIITSLLTQPKPKLTGLVASYPFNGNANDESGNGYNGIIHGDTSLCEDRFGNSNSAYCFDGNGDYIEIGQEPDIPSWDNYAVSLWFLNDGGGDNTSGYGQKIIDKTVWYHDFYLRVQTQLGPGEGLLYYFTYEAGGAGIVYPSRDFRDNLWHHAVINKSGSYGELWVDGNLIESSNDIKTVNSNGDLLFGYSLSGDSYQRKYWSGKIDDIRIYDRTLSVNEIKAIYQDLDSDGIHDEVDENPLTPSNRFSDVSLGGVTSGQILNLDTGITVRITDAAAPNGVRVVVSGPAGGVASIEIYGSAGTYNLSPGEHILTSGSVTLEVVQGSADVEFTIDGTPVTVHVADNSTIVCDETIVDGELQTLDLTVVEGEVTVNDVPVPPGQTLSTMSVDIDIKPGSYPNCFNNDGKGVIPVAILSSLGFDATQVDPLTVSLDGQDVKVAGKKGNVLAHFEDVNSDGLDDLMLQIQDEDGTYEPGEGMATLTGETFDGGTAIIGTDSICIVP